MSGTRFAAPGANKQRVILLVHGHSVTKRFWDWKPDYSVARLLARAGYVVISYDRLTVGESTYAADNAVTFDSDRNMIAEIVEQIRGTYPLPATVPVGSCPSGESADVAAGAKVILIGHSLGGALVSGYPGEWGRVAPVDALIQSNNSNMGSTDDASKVELAKGESSTNITAGRISLFLDDGSTPSSKSISATTCAENIRLLLYTGIRTARDLYRDACSPSSFEPVPYADYDSAVIKGQENQALIPQTAAFLPVLLTWTQFDGFGDADPSHSTGPTGCGAAGCVGAEVNYWKTNCPCANHVTSWTLPRSGHAFIWSPTMPEYVYKVMSWLAANGLGARLTPS